jgi:hypothetical protein
LELIVPKRRRIPVFTKTKTAVAAAIVLGTASAVLAEPSGVVETRFPTEAISQSAPVYEGRNAAIIEGRNAAVQRPVQPFTAAEKALFDRANGNLNN